MIRLFKSLRQAGILGMNERNARFVMLHNKRSNYPLVDDKLITKRRAQDAGIHVPTLYGVIEIEHQIRGLPRMLGEIEDFVVKPAHGSGGNGIMVITDRHGGNFRLANGVLVGMEEVGHHISNILSGMHSLGGQPDRAMIEQRVQFDPMFEEVSYRGVPDIRTVVFKGVPVMAMVRLPTRRSNGKANLHQGALGVGLDMGTGLTTTAVWKERFVDEHPDTGNPIAGLRIPEWGTLLELAARCYHLADLGYLGVDVVLDRHQGPMVLELNARPGLSIQLANRRSLLRRLEQVEALDDIPEDPRQRVAITQDLFAKNNPPAPQTVIA
ncbi:alpha-L-glutamate ligase-like protein [Methylonatrum kenyense]|uniref:alpha-L-glutamate ligase-like protein n=1 Tax=Methylonatrum kenyense TaxID=455253 RepID=UPI0020C01D6C|nr:alpha-L-glutamate ligase-like protein [Methylonatrum kenyense]MCK8515099.1 alpha-L-glutamate ligase-like protein [Methylonatrum kenyense]